MNTMVSYATGSTTGSGASVVFYESEYLYLTESVNLPSNLLGGDDQESVSVKTGNRP